MLYGGAAGGGKSDALLRECLLEMEDKPVKALLIRRTFTDLSQPGGLMARSHEWLGDTDAHWVGGKNEWSFPSGGKLKFGYMENENDHLKYQGGEYHVVGFDELTQMREYQYLYLFSRMRKLVGADIDVRCRAATNPGGPGHEWVRKRWNLPYGPKDSTNRKFVQAFLDDNPHIDQEDYLAGLQELKSGSSDVTYRQLRQGDWTAVGSGGFFNPENFNIIPLWHPDFPSAHEFENIVRYWDFGATEKTELNQTPDYTVGLKIGRTRRGKIGPLYLPDWYVLDVVREQAGPGRVEKLVVETARKDGVGVSQWFEQERGAAGKNFVYQFRAHHIPDSNVRGMYVTGDKETRAKGPAARVDDGRVWLVEGEWNDDFLAETGVFPEGDYDDQVDTLGYGFMALERELNMAESGQVYRRGQQAAKATQIRTRKTKTQQAKQAAMTGVRLA